MRYALLLLLLGCSSHTTPHVSETVQLRGEGFQKFVYQYPVSSASLTGLSGNLSITTYGDNFGEGLFVIGYSDASDCFDRGTKYLDYPSVYIAHPTLKVAQQYILKQPVRGTNTIHVAPDYIPGIAFSGCLTVVMDIGPAADGMAASFDLDVSLSNRQPLAYILSGGSEFCFGQPWGCQAAGPGPFYNDVVVPTRSKLIRLIGDVSDSALIGSDAPYGPAPAAGWGTVNSYSALGVNLLTINMSGFGLAILQTTVNHPVTLVLNEGDVITAGVSMSGFGAVDTENQVSYLLLPL